MQKVAFCEFVNKLWRGRRNRPANYKSSVWNGQTDKTNPKSCYVFNWKLQNYSLKFILCFRKELGNNVDILSIFFPCLRERESHVYASGSCMTFFLQDSLLRSTFRTFKFVWNVQCLKCVHKVDILWVFLMNLSNFCMFF